MSGEKVWLIGLNGCGKPTLFKLITKEEKSISGIISHDRYFINKIAKKILYVENNNIKEYLGNYDDYCNTKENNYN